MAKHGEGRFAPTPSLMSESDARRLLTTYGLVVPQHVLVGVDTALSDEPDLWPPEQSPGQRGLKPPLALKAVSPQLVHKSDVGGVVLDIRSVGELGALCRRMHGAVAQHGVSLQGFLVEEMAPPGVELVVGGVEDPTFGPSVMVGVGGIHTELFGDVAFAVCPISLRDARHMLTRLRAHALLRGYRGGPAVDEAAVAEFLVRIGGEGGLYLDNREQISQFDLNPVICSGREQWIVDAAIFHRDAA